MTAIRVMAVFQGQSNLPEDRFINVFHFHDPTGLDYASDADEARGRVAAFYTVSSGSADPPGMHLSPYVKRLASVVSYDLTEPEGQRPPTTETFTLGTTPNDGLPEEVAVVITLEGAPPVTPRRRGRLYIGPLRTNSDTVTPASITAPARPVIIGATSLGESLTFAAAFLADDPSSLEWCIRSTVPAENFVPIVGGYIDNALDTQRRRGPETTSRRLWTA